MSFILTHLEHFFLFYFYIYFSFFQLPAVLSKVPGVPTATGMPVASVPSAQPIHSLQVQPQSQGLPPSQPFAFSGYQNQPVFSGSHPPGSNQTDSDSDTEIPSLALPCRAGSAISDNYLPMISTEDKWLSDPDYR